MKRQNKKDTIKFRSQSQLICDRLNYYSSKKKKNDVVSKPVEDNGLILVPPVNGVKGNSINFTVPSDGFSCLTFLNTHHLQGELDFKVKYEVYSDDTYTTKTSTLEEELLRPSKHGWCLPSSVGLLTLFKSAYVSFDSYGQQLASYPGGSLNWLNRIGVMETAFQADSYTVSELAEYGLIANFNRYLTDLTNIMGDSVAELWPNTDAQKGPRTFFMRLPIFPFRLFSPWQNQKIRRNLGAHMVAGNGAVIPKNVDFNLTLEVEKNIPALYRFTKIAQDHSLLAKIDPTDADKMEWRRFTFKKNDDTIMHCKMIEIVPELTSLHLVACRLKELTPRIETLFTQYYTVYRSALHKLESASMQTLHFGWDIDQQPTTLILGFVRDE